MSCNDRQYFGPVVKINIESSITTLQDNHTLGTHIFHLGNFSFLEEN
jgi:hypothetical protein